MNMYEKIKNNGIAIPDEFKKGEVCIGTTCVNGVEEKIYFNNDGYYDGHLIISGKMGSGKNEYLKNYTNDCVFSDKPVILISNVESIKPSDFQRLIDEDKMVVIDIDDSKLLQSLSYNELNFDDSEPSTEKIKKILNKSQYLLETFKSISKSEFTVLMNAYFLYASTIVYSVKNNASFENIIEFLKDEDIRNDFLNRVPEDLKEYLEKEINICKKISNLSMSKQSSLEKIYEEVSNMEQNMMLRLMIKKTSEDNIDFTKCLEEGKSIFIKMNRKICNNEMKDILNLFLINKAYLASRVFKSKSLEVTNQINIIINNEIYSDVILKKIDEISMYSKARHIKLVLTSYNLSSIKSLIENSYLRTFNYMLLSSIDSNTSKILNELMNIEVDTAYCNMPKYHSFNIMLNKNYEYSSFVTKLPPLLKYKMYV